MATSIKVRIGAVVMSLVAAQVSAAYDHPLDSHSIREAYFLGQRNDDKAAKFLAQYVKRLPLPKTGPHVAEIEVRTPYEQAVLRSRQHSVGYSAQQAEKDYSAQPDLIVVRVQINLTPTYSVQMPATPSGTNGFRLRPDDFWRDFTIGLVQEKAITPKKISGTPIYMTGYRTGSSLTGAQVLVEYDAAQVASAPVRVEVLTPGGRTVVAEFDLKDLR
jgi:hypothetical protein